jgi:hypothetical protein
MDDAEIVKRIDALVDEEHHLEAAHEGVGITEEDRDRLKDIEVQLDQCWDLLRQRRARRNAGQDPDQAKGRPANIVEGYRQ